MAHTRGPWHTGQTDQPQTLYWGIVAILDLHNPGKRVLVWADEPVKDHEANARLIAAAPELLATCQNMLVKWDNQHPIDRQRLRQAVAKATKGAEMREHAEA